ncbi:hypothetical protein [Streptomyces albicerus]|uniref:hypothetical protein n=1 Tax=Streptomyces albicerus TaxID=2569859 RepID=UPI00124BAAA3|nr:hypothetical protein [Streptomyces albicerus]
MVSATRAAHNIEITAESLQEELARLQIQKQALERELAAVVAHLGSVQRALSALETLMLDPAAAASTATAGATGAQRGQATVATAEPQTDSASAEPADTTTKAAPQPPRKPQSGKDAERPVAVGTDMDGQKQYGKLTEQIMEYFASVGDVDVRARDVAAALGRDTDSGSINGVRSTLDRLVGASRVRRTGRGLYRAAKRS